MRCPTADTPMTRLRPQGRAEAPPRTRKRGDGCHHGGVTGPEVPGTPQRRDIVILGSTGSVGTQALAVVRANPDRFRVVGLTAGGTRPGLFEEQRREFAPAYSGMGEEASVAAAGLP